MEDYSRQRHERGRLRVRELAPHHQGRRCSRRRATSTGTPTACSRRCSSTTGRRGHDYYLKPMNCPFHILIFRSRQRSYRELPLRLFEFGTVYRYEKSGVVHGLTRVRGMTQDDAHIFCTQGADGRRARVAPRLRARPAPRLRPRATSTSSCRPGLPGRRSAPTRSGTRPPRRCARRRRAMDLELVLDEGGGAFYGPKISVQARDAIGRTWQMSTIQLDFQLPQRFEHRVHRRRRRAPPPDHDPPGAVRLDRAVLRRAARALRRRVPGVAGARAGARAAGARRPRRLRPAQVVDRAAGRRASGPTWSRRARSSATASARPRSRSCPTSSWWATTTSRPAPSASTRAAARSSAACTLDAFAQRVLDETAGSRGPLITDGGQPDGASRPPTVASAGGGPSPALAHLWAGWRYAYIDRRPPMLPSSGPDDDGRSLFERILTAACPTTRPTSCGEASGASPCSTRTPTAAAT